MNKKEIMFFDRISATWDEDEVLSTPEKIRNILSYLNIKKGMKILDLGTGTGVLIPYIQELIGEEGKLVAVDISRGMLSKAIEKYDRFDNLEFLLKDFEKEEIIGKFDKILLYCVYPHLHQPLETIKKLLTTNINPGGNIIIAFPTDEHFINNIHKEKKAESDLLPPCNLLARKFKDNGINAEVVVYDAERYILKISQ